MKIGIIADSLKKELFAALKEAKELGAAGVQIYAKNENGRWNLLDFTDEQLAALKAELEKNGLEVSAVCGDLGGHAFQDPASDRVAVTKRIMDIAKYLGSKVVTCHIGTVPEDPAHERFQVMKDQLIGVAQYGESIGVTLAVETGPETAVTLKRFIDAVGSKGLGVNLDPANLKMVLDEDIPNATRILGPHIVHTHAKDGVHYRKCDPFLVYNAFAEGGFAQLVAETGELFAEVPLGEGQVPWDEYLAALKAIPFDGYLTIEREVGANPAADIATAVSFLKSKIG